MTFDLTTYLHARACHDYRTMVTIINNLDYSDYDDVMDDFYSTVAQDLPLLVKQPFLITYEAFETNAFSDSFLRHFSIGWIPLSDYQFSSTLNYLIEHNEMVLVHAWIAALQEELLFNPSWAPVFVLGILSAGVIMTENYLYARNPQIQKDKECFIAQYATPLQGMFNVNILDYLSYDIPVLEELTFNIDAWNHHCMGEKQHFSEIPLCL